MQLTADATDYYCLHDVDAVPILANYACPSQPLRLVTRLVSTHGDARQRNCHYFSGAVSIRKDQAFAANGFSNDYWGWGKEDDDFFFRLLLAGYLCYFDAEGMFRDLPNPRIPGRAVVRSYVKQNRQRRSLLLRGLADPAEDGLSTVSTRCSSTSSTPTTKRYACVGERDCALATAPAARALVACLLFAALLFVAMCPPAGRAAPARICH